MEEIEVVGQEIVQIGAGGLGDTSPQSEPKRQNNTGNKINKNRKAPHHKGKHQKQNATKKYKKQESSKHKMQEKQI